MIRSLAPDEGLQSAFKDSHQAAGVEQSQCFSSEAQRQQWEEIRGRNTVDKDWGTEINVLKSVD